MSIPSTSAPAPVGEGSLPRRAHPWRALAAYLRRPVLPDRADIGFIGGVRAIVPLLALDVLIMAVLIGALSLAHWLGYTLPEHALDTMKMTPVLVGMIVVAAPIAEETAFRSWLSGRPGHLLALLVLAIGAAWAVLLHLSVKGLAGLAIAAVIAAGIAWSLRRRPALGWFQRHFAWFYWGSALAFAAMHLTNFAAAGIAMLPLVMPQFVLALLLGYLRVHRGLWASMTLHSLHNAFFIGIVLLGLG